MTHWIAAKADDIFKIAPLVTSLISLVVSSAVATFSISVNRRLKAMDVVVKCQEQYDRIAFDARHAVKTEEEAKLYYDRFWSLQWNQFEFWRDKHIGKDRYGFWMFCRNQEWKLNESIAGICYRDGWQWAVSHRNWQSTKFADHMEKVFSGTSPIFVDYCKHSLRPNLRHF